MFHLSPSRSSSMVWPGSCFDHQLLHVIDLKGHQLAIAQIVELLLHPGRECRAGEQNRGLGAGLYIRGEAHRGGLADIDRGHHALCFGGDRNDHRRLVEPEGLQIAGLRLERFLDLAIGDRAGQIVAGGLIGVGLNRLEDLPLAALVAADLDFAVGILEVDFGDVGLIDLEQLGAFRDRLALRHQVGRGGDHREQHQGYDRSAELHPARSKRGA